VVDGRRRRGKTQVRRLSAGWGLALGLCALLGFPSRGLAGMLDTPLPTFSDGKSAQVVGLLPRVIKNHNLETVVVCTNLDTVAANIGLEVFDKDGVLVNSVNAGNGEILNVAVGATRTIGTAATALLTEDHKMTLLPDLRNGSGRVVASEAKVFCAALLVDQLHAIVEPSICPTCPVPSLVSAPVWACGNSIVDPFEQCDDGNLEGGDGCSASCASEDPCFGKGGDTDGDTICDAEDPCVHFANTLPLVISGFSGIPDECLCGDFDGDGFHSATDAAAINDCAAFIRFDCVSLRDEVAAPIDGFYSATDADQVSLVSAFLEPVFQLTCGLRPEGTCGGATGVSCF